MMPPDISTLYLEVLLYRSDVRVEEVDGNTYMIRIDHNKAIYFGNYPSYNRRLLTVMLYPGKGPLDNTKRTHFGNFIDKTMIVTSPKLWNKINK